MKSEKGITLVILVITVIVLAIIATIMINYGGNSLDAVELQNFQYELEQVQGKVNVIYEKIKLGDEEYIKLGKNITESEQAMSTLKTVAGIDYLNISDSQREEYYYQNQYTYYRYLTQSNVQNLLGLTSTPGDMIINFKTREVISVQGFEYKGEMYYTLKEI